MNYDEFVDASWRGDEDLAGRFVMTAGLGGESGEVQELIHESMLSLLMGQHAGRSLEFLKKEVRDRREISADLKNELGDVLFYLTKIAHTHGFTLEDVRRRT